MDYLINRNYEKLFIAWIITLILMIGLMIIIGGLTFQFINANNQFAMAA